MSSRPKNVVELRRELAEKFPGVRMTAERPSRLSNRWPTGIGPFDAALDGGLARSAITELITPGVASGASLVIAGLIDRARSDGQWLALIDARDSFDPAGLDNSSLERLLWLRCSNVREAIKTTDLLLHDGTAAVAILDLSFCAPQQLRKVPSSTWFRLERLVENTPTALLVISPEAMISTAETRLRLERRFSLEALDQPHAMLFNQLQPTLVKSGTRMVKIA